jgi:small subunit ribosomal protein S16
VLPQLVLRLFLGEINTVAVTLRLARFGVRGNPFYRVVACDKQAPRDGKYLEIVGTFAPTGTKPSLDLKEELLKKWLSYGAIPTLTVKNLIRKKFPGLVEEKEAAKKAKTQARRKARKARAAKKATKK